MGKIAYWLKCEKCGLIGPVKNTREAAGEAWNDFQTARTVRRW
jgi:hypothetical protein